jgi:predicted DNA-binding transcriptional regulator AlpA
MTNGLMDTAEAARRCGLAKQTLAVLRVEGGGPRYVKLGRRVAYDPADIAAWIEANKRSNTSEQPIRDGQ